MDQARGDADVVEGVYEHEQAQAAEIKTLRQQLLEALAREERLKRLAGIPNDGYAATQRVKVLREVLNEPHNVDELVDFGERVGRKLLDMTWRPDDTQHTFIKRAVDDVLRRLW